MLVHATNDGTVPVRYISSDYAHCFTFSVCSLVARQDSYDRLMASFAAHGFTGENTEFLAADNRNGNDFDGYSWTRRLVSECRGKYVIFCHDDVELIEDGFDKLRVQLDELTSTDPDWLLAGNAGGRVGWQDIERVRRRNAVTIKDRYGDRHAGADPVRVETLDENFIVMRRDRLVLGSLDLGGFHFYGPDLCMMAEIVGGTSYVIDFSLRHHGSGTRGPSFRSGRTDFARKYGRFFPGRRVWATTGEVLLGDEQPHHHAFGTLGLDAQPIKNGEH